RSGPGTSALWGALYGYLSYAFLAPWLGSFHPYAGLFVSLIHLCYMALLFPLLKTALILYPRRGYILQWLLWLGYEYLKTRGFLGFPYGITGYTQWEILPLIQIASVFGVWGVSALVLFPSVYLGAAWKGGKVPGPGLEMRDLSLSVGGIVREAKAFFRREAVPALVWAAALGGALVFGFVSPGDYSAEPEAKIALIQQNADPWDTPGGYRNALKTLTALSRASLEAEPDTDLVVWSETAFVPRIYWHLNYRDDDASYGVVKELLDFLALQRVPYLIGNDDGRQEAVSGSWDRVDYNAALLFEGDNIAGVYRKIHLVPFAEYFPYEKNFPRLYRALLKADTHFWKPGKEEVVFTAGKLRFSAPICFEDSFGYISRNFTRNGAELIVNLTNDGWAGDLSCQMQHLAMAVFRAVENRRSLVRAAATGQTCAVDPRGKVLAMAEPFTESFLNVRLPLLKSSTPYTRWGDLWGILFSLSAAAVLLIGAIGGILGLIKTGRNK
ncbi:MAG: apolipoprotein N-acyltransferase, partial [Treponema sp.]|nr:apolipoprotein N-acyltransferase [Treponema sp.]